MNSLFNKAYQTLKYDGVSVLLLRVWNYGIIKIKRLTLNKSKDGKQKWKLLKDKYKGERIFIIGNGPSLNETPLYLLKNEYTMCFNRFNLMFERLSWTPDMYVVTDDLVIKDIYNDINNIVMPVVKYGFFPDLHPSNVNFTEFIEDKENVYWLNTDIPEFRADLPYCGINKTVVNAGLQIAAYMGFKEIYLIGVDMTFANQKVKKINSRNWQAAESDPNHFDPRYFSAGRKFHNPTTEEMIEKFEIGKTFFDGLGVNVFNAGYKSELDVFPRIDFRSLFSNLSAQQEEQLLSDSPILVAKGIKFEDLSANAVELKEITLSSLPEVFKMEGDVALPVIPKIIMEYVCVGPYKNYYYFIKK